MAAPQDDVFTDHAAHELDNLWVAGQVEERTTAAHALAVVPFYVR
jgi:hypothetical protein